MRLRRYGLCLLSTLAGLLLATGLFGLAAVASAAPAGAPATDRSYPGVAPCATTLQACINGSNAGDVINIAAGVFTESFTLSKAVSLVGAGMDQTVLHAAAGQRVFSATYTTTQPVTIANLTIEGGDRSIVGFYPNGQGGGVLLEHDVAPVTFNSVAFRHNTARDGGGLFAGYNVTLTLTNTHFINNHATASGGGLGAYFGVTLTITNSQFLGNTAARGGGLHNPSKTVMEGVGFISNTATGPYAYGGGAATGTGRVTASHFERNSNLDGGGGGLWTAASVIGESTFLSNTAGRGGGLMAIGLAALVNVTFTGNTASRWGGGGYFVDGAELTHAVAVNNQAADGGAFFFSNLSQRGWLSDSVLSGNVALSSTGTAGIVFGYMRAPAQSFEALVNTHITGTGQPDSRALQMGLGRALALTGTSISGHDVDAVSLGAMALRPTGYITSTSGFGECAPEMISYTRPITIWYGTLQANGVPVLAVASASDRFSEGMLQVLDGTGRPKALLELLQPWTKPNDMLTFIDQVTGPGDGLNAEANLRAALAGAWRPSAYSGVRFDVPVDRGSETNLLIQYGSYVECGEDIFQEQTIGYYSHMVFFELNATAIERLFLPLVRR